PPSPLFPSTTLFRSTAELIVHPDPVEAVARFDFGDQQWVLRQGEWSNFVRASFPLIPGLKSATGIFRVYLKQVHPHLVVYVSPIDRKSTRLNSSHVA